MSDEPLQLLTTAEAASLLRVSRRTIERMIAAGDLRAFKWGNITRIYRTDLEQFVSAHTSQAPKRSQKSADCSGRRPTGICQRLPRRDPNL